MSSTPSRHRRGTGPHPRCARAPECCPRHLSKRVNQTVWRATKLISKDRAAASSATDQKSRAAQRPQRGRTGHRRAALNSGCCQQTSGCERPLAAVSGCSAAEGGGCRAAASVAGRSGGGALAEDGEKELFNDRLLRTDVRAERGREFVQDGAERCREGGARVEQRGDGRA